MEWTEQRTTTTITRAEKTNENDHIEWPKRHPNSRMEEHTMSNKGRRRGKKMEMETTMASEIEMEWQEEPKCRNGRPTTGMAKQPVAEQRNRDHRRRPDRRLTRYVKTEEGREKKIRKTRRNR